MSKIIQKTELYLKRLVGQKMEFLQGDSEAQEQEAWGCQELHLKTITARMICVNDTIKHTHTLSTNHLTYEQF